MSAAFAEIRFEAGYIIYNTEGGAQFNTDVVSLNSGYEARNSIWQFGRGKWDFGDRKLPDTELKEIINFFRARKGRAQGFRFKDWADYKDDGNGVLGLNGVGDGSTKVFQMVKNYPSGTDKDQRVIRKPVAGTISFYSAGALINGTNWLLDTTTGVVTFTVAPGAGALTWKGEFDCPVRFDTDDLKYRFDSASIASPGVVSATYFYVSPLPLVEIRA